ncbi:MAG: mechanosensitive ion channel family protein [Halobacteriota archaeon]
MTPGGVARPLQTATPEATTPPSFDGSALGELLPSWAKFPGWELVAAAFIILAGVYLSKLLVRLLGRSVARRFQRQSVAQTVLRMVRIVTILVSGFVALSVLGLPIGDVVLPVTVFSAVLGIILAPIVGSLVSGLFILADEPFEIGDMIELDTGSRGFVEDITLRYTKVFTLDNTFLVIPNSTIRERDIVNYSAEDERTRLTLKLLVTYEGDLTEARRVMEHAAGNVEEVIEGGPDIRIGSARYPAKPTCYIEEYADHGILLTLRYWAQKPYKLMAIRSKVNEQVWDQLEEADVDIAYPHQHLVFDETSGQARVAVESVSDVSSDVD